MTLFEFSKHFPDERSCKVYLRQQREKQGLSCDRCGSILHYWKKDKECWECKSCKRRISLTSGTMLHRTKLPLLYWFFTIHLLSSTKKSFSALEIQCQLGHKFYEPIWLMVHKIREAMGKRDDKYLLGGELEIDEGFFTTFTLKEKLTSQDKQLTECHDSDEGKGKKSNKSSKRGRGSERKTTVLVIVESTNEEEPKKNKPDRKVGYLKMIAIPDARSETINEVAGQRVENDAHALTDGHKGYGELENELEKLEQVVAKGPKSCKVFPWVHICISNAKRWFLGINHAIGSSYIQNYLNEFVYNFNRRYMSKVLFERLIIAGISNKNTFKSRFRC